MFVAGASGVIGLPLCKMLLVAGYEVYGTTRSAAKAEMLAAQGIKPVVADAFDAEGLLKTVGEIRPDVIFHELTDLPDGLAADQMEAALVRNARIRDEGTRNLVRAAKAAGVKKSSRKALRLCMRPMRRSLLPRIRRCWILPSRLTAKPPARCTAWSSKSPPTLRLSALCCVMAGCMARARALMRLWILPRLCTRKQRRTRRCWRCNASNRVFITRQTTMRGCRARRRNASWV